MNSPVRHKPYCFAGELAPCAGYFLNDLLPCVCTAVDVVAALSQQAIPAQAGTPAPARASAALECAQKATALSPRPA